MTRPETNKQVMALDALGWTLEDSGRASRLLAVTGLDPSTLRAGLGDPQLLAALIRFLEEHEPDLIACADAIGATPEALVAARRELEA